MFGVLLFLLIALYLEWFRPVTTFFIAIIILTLAGILSPEEVLHGFANEQLAVIILLLVFSEIIRTTSVIDYFFNRLFKGASSVRGFMFRMMAYVASGSSIFNNTPLVAMMMPYVYNWSRKKHVSPAKLMIPLSYAAILGGCVTLVGTSTNLIVNGMAIEAGLESLRIFDFLWVGLPMLFIGMLYLLIFGLRLLPDRKEMIEEFVETSREYFVEAMVEPESPLIGKTIVEAELRHLKGLFLVEILRGNYHITAVPPDEILEENDTLIFTGNTDALTELRKPEMGLQLHLESELPEHDEPDIVEVVVSHNSRLMGKRIQDTDFRGTWDAAILAVHRNRARLSGKIGDIELKAGDVLLLLAGNDFHARTAGVQAFYVISKEEKPKEANVNKVLVMVLGIVAAIVLSALNILPLFTGLLILLGIVLIMNVVSLSVLRKGMDYSVLFILALGLALGKAMINSGAAGLMADWVLSITQPFGPMVLLAVIFLIGNLLAAYITNKAAVAILFPVSLSIALSMELNPTPFILIVAYGCAASFITPIGYQTNLMVYGPGGYSFRDFFRIGLPLTLMYMAGSVLILAYVYKLF